MPHSILGKGEKPRGTRRLQACTLTAASYGAHLDQQTLQLKGRSLPGTLGTLEENVLVQNPQDHRLREKNPNVTPLTKQRVGVTGMVTQNANLTVSKIWLPTAPNTSPHWEPLPAPPSPAQGL